MTAESSSKSSFSLYTIQVEHQARAYPGFCTKKWTGAFLPLLNGMLDHCRVTPSIEFAGARLYTWVERGIVRVKCLAQKHNILYSVNHHLVCTQPKWPIRPELMPVSVARSEQGYFYYSLDGMLVHCRVTPSTEFTGTRSYTWGDRGTVKVKCLAQEHNTMSPARARTHADCSIWSRPH